MVQGMHGLAYKGIRSKQIGKNRYDIDKVGIKACKDHHIWEQDHSAGKQSQEW